MLLAEILFHPPALVEAVPLLVEPRYHLLDLGPDIFQITKKRVMRWRILVTRNRNRKRM